MMHTKMGTTSNSGNQALGPLHACLLSYLLLGCATAKIQPTNVKWEAAIEAFEAEDEAHPVQPGSVLFIGSSSIRMWESLPADFPKAKVLNRGFGGSQIVDSIYFADRIIIPYAPKSIFLYAGDNDIAKGKDAKTVLRDFKQFAKKVHRALPNARIYFIAIKPSIRRWHLAAEMAKANSLVEAFTQGDERLDFVDIWTPMLDETNRPKKSLFIDDGLHMNHEGYEVWRKAILPLL
ncbi:MAG: hypothetical protein M2R45_04888 [Verrucomicrobia subdivision 3 bacterium]|nr:hypothetical protein [Limisphaerales bacterium]MCS1414382.1 hypothetical protein [Limisphaerales bacterium]